MHSTTSRSLRALAAAAVLFATVGSVALADTTVLSTTLAGPMAGDTVVRLWVSNLGKLPAKGVVSVQAVVGGTLVTGYAPVSLMPGQSTIVVVPFGSTVQGVLDVATASTSTTIPTTLGVIGDEVNPY